MDMDAVVKGPSDRKAEEREGPILQRQFEGANRNGTNSVAPLTKEVSHSNK